MAPAVVLDVFKVRLEREVVAPAFPERLIVPDPAVKLSACVPAIDPLMVLLKEMAPLFALVSMVDVLVSCAVPVKLKELAVMLPPIDSPTALVDVALKAPRRVVPPTTPERVIAPVPDVRVRA